MKTVHIDGVIGWDVLAADIRKELTGKEIDLAISSPGGSVYEGLAIFNAVRDFRKKGGTVNARIIGMAASMATYIPLAADTVSIEDNAIFMIHNSWSLAIGNKKEMRKQAEILGGIDSLLNKEYTKKSGREDIEDLMDSETYLFGQEIIEYGFADSMEQAGDGATDKKEAVAVARNAMSEMFSKISAEPEKQNLGKVAAMIKNEIPTIKPVEKPDVVGNKETAREAGKREARNMNIDELKKDNLALFNQVVGEGEKAGIEKGVAKERARRNSINEYAKLDLENEGLQAHCKEAIETGAEANGVFITKAQMEIQKGMKLQGENAETVDTTQTGSATLTAEEIALCENFEITKEEYLKNREV